jgi:ABC-type glutathione transport system ATPase component
MNTIIEVNNLSYLVLDKKLFGGVQTKTILDDISFNLQRERILGVAGESGSGKTTLAKLLAGILAPTSGNISFNFRDSWKNTQTNPIQILFQNNGEILNPLREIGDVVEEANKIKLEQSDEASKKNIFNSVNLNEKLWARKGFELSGGEQQRAALARILAVQPEVLILDEPFSAQDPASQLNLLNLFKSINKNFKITLICISHNLKVLRALCDDLIILYKGKIVEHGESKKIFENPQHPYTSFLLKAEDYSLSYDEIMHERELFSE